VSLLNAGDILVDRRFLSTCWQILAPTGEGWKWISGALTLYHLEKNRKVPGPQNWGWYVRLTTPPV